MRVDYLTCYRTSLDFQLKITRKYNQNFKNACYYNFVFRFLPGIENFGNTKTYRSI